MSDRLGVMSGGELQQVGTPEEVYLHPRTRFVAAFLGAVNWIDDVGVRPEATRIARTAPNSGTRSHPATVARSTFLGNCLHVEARLSSGQPVVAEVSRFVENFNPDESVFVWWRPEDELRFV